MFISCLGPPTPNFLTISEKFIHTMIARGCALYPRKLDISMTHGAIEMSGNMMHREKYKFILFLILFTFILGLGSPAPQFWTISEQFINPIIPIGCALHPRKLHFYDPWG